MKKLQLIKNIIWGIVIIECIILSGLVTNRIIKLENKTDNLEKQIIELKRGN